MRTTAVRTTAVRKTTMRTTAVRDAAVGEATVRETTPAGAVSFPGTRRARRPVLPVRASALLRALQARPLTRRRVLLAALAAALVPGGFVAADVAGADVTPGPALAVDATAGTHPISPYVYGIATFGMTPALSEMMRVPIERWGGDAVTRYNWEYNTTNSGGDWFYIGGQQTGGEVPSADPDAQEQMAQQSGGTMLMTVPVIPWISGPARSICSFPTPPYPPQSWYSWAVTLPDGARCGDDNTAPTISNNWVDTDIAQENVANSPALEQAWVSHLVSKFGSAADGGVAIYEMDNEPGGWSNTHRDVHPHLTGWNELVDDTEEYASAVKTADPTALVDGPGDFNWWDSNGPPGDNSAAHGLSYLGQYYLQQIAAYQASAAWQDAHPGLKVIDDFDEHFYPSGPASAGSIGLALTGDAANQQARLDSTCELVDTSCTVDGQTMSGYGVITIEKNWIATYDPGIPPAISEYDWGGHDTINGAVAEADVLGIFGAQGLELASMWGVPTETSGVPQPVVFAFEMYRNYDGQGDGFGDTSVQATSGGATNSSASTMSVFGATRSSDGALTIMVMNKTDTDLTSPLTISDFPGATSSGATAQVYTYDTANLDAVVRQPDLDLSATGTTSVTFPAYSMTELVIPPAGTDEVPPGVPTGVSATTSAGAASVSFTPPAANSGPPVTSYSVTATDSDGTSAPIVGYGSQSPITVPGLTLGHSYTFTVSATNLAGTTTSTSTGAASAIPTTTSTTATT
ncbi:MAG TPA: glycoside hydrolase family 44 protein, partial [Acidimicrobiales bacterium]|nr:glycoside hydrolase family 44 protein [Acidimicrobiales bacterium]